MATPGRAQGGAALDKERAAALSNMDLTRIVRAYVQQLADEVPGYKALLLDRETMRIVSTLFGRTELAEHSIVHVERLDAAGGGEGKEHMELKVRKRQCARAATRAAAAAARPALHSAAAACGSQLRCRMRGITARAASNAGRVPGRRIVLQLRCSARRVCSPSSPSGAPAQLPRQRCISALTPAHSMRACWAQTGTCRRPAPPQAVAFVRPTRENVTLLKRELRQPRYQSYHLCELRPGSWGGGSGEGYLPKGGRC